MSHLFSTITALLDNGVSVIQTWLYVNAVQPVLFHVGLMDVDEDTYDALYWFVIAMFEIVAMFLVLRPLEALRPLERWESRRSVRVDAFYTWVIRLGLINVLFFLFMQPWFDQAQEWLRLRGISNLQLDALWPDPASRPFAGFVIYLVVLDFVGYWYHRWQHRFGWWWELHAVHHSQQFMSMWSDERNHLLDNVLQACVFAALALAIGVQPSQYVVLIAVSQVLQSVQHINARLPFGPVLERVLVSPAFHRRHHAIGYGHEGVYYGCNFGVLFPWWDMLFKTASWSKQYEPTGIRDQLPSVAGAGRNYGAGFFSQQWLGLVRSLSRMLRWGRSLKSRRVPGASST